MADSLSRSEIESLLAATKADSVLLPKPNVELDDGVDFESFQHNAVAEGFFARLAQDTVDCLKLSTDLNLSVGDISEGSSTPGNSGDSIQPVPQSEQPLWTVNMSSTDGEQWAVLFFADLVFPLIGSILGSPIENDGREQKLSFIEERLIRPVLAKVAGHLNQQGYADGLLQLKDDGDEVAHPDSQTVTCSISGPDFVGTMKLVVPKTAIDGLEIPAGRTKTVVSTTQVEVCLTETSIAAGDISSLEIGDILMTDIDPESLLTATVDDLPTFRGTMGIFQGRKALQIAEKVAKLR